MRQRMSLSMYAVIAAALCATPCVRAQAPAAGSPDYASMMKAMQDAQAAAIKPGDNKLNCKQLQDEFTTVTTDPALHGLIQSAGAQSQQDIAAAQVAQAEIPARTALAAASAAPGGGAAATAAAMASDRAAIARGAVRQPAMMAQAAQFTASMPKFLRGQRLTELASAKKCAWVAALSGAATQSTAKPSAQAPASNAETLGANQSDRFEGTFSQESTTAGGVSVLTGDIQETLTGRLVWRPDPPAGRASSFGDTPSTFYRATEGEITVEYKSVGTNAVGPATCTTEGRHSFAISGLPPAVLEYLTLEIASDGRYRMVLVVTDAVPSNYEADSTCRFPTKVVRQKTPAMLPALIIGEQQGSMDSDRALKGEMTPQNQGPRTVTGKWEFRIP